MCRLASFLKRLNGKMRSDPCGTDGRLDLGRGRVDPEEKPCKAGGVGART